MEKSLKMLQSLDSLLSRRHFNCFWNSNDPINGAVEEKSALQFCEQRKLRPVCVSAQLVKELSFFYHIQYLNYVASNIMKESEKANMSCLGRAGAQAGPSPNQGLPCRHAS